MKSTGVVRKIDELGRIEKIELERRSLARNDKEVFRAAIDALKAESGKKQDESDPFADLKRMQALHKQAKEKKNT